LNSYWNPLIKRIQSESHHCNGTAKSGSKKLNSVSQVTVRIVLQDGNPIMWEIAGSCKAEPTSLVESIARVGHSIRRLSELCQSSQQVGDIIEKLVDSLVQKSN
jgi:hypothetical protein